MSRGRVFSVVCKRAAACFFVASNFSAFCEPQVFTSKKDHYNGVIIDPSALPSGIDDFSSSLQHSLDSWKADDRRGVWLKIPIKLANLIPEAVLQGFVFHHAEADYVMLVQWLPKSSNQLPPYASHQVGVGCVLVKDGKLLVVQEKRGVLRGSGVWKVPTGLLDAGEDVGDAAEREVFEETGVKSVFKGVLGLRHMHGALFGKSDLFFVCLLEAESTELVAQAREIEAVEWQDVDAYLQQPRFRESPLYARINELIAGVANESECNDLRKVCPLRVTKYPTLNYVTGKTADVCLYHPND